MDRDRFGEEELIKKFDEKRERKAQEIEKAIKSVKGVKSIEYDTSEDDRLYVTVYLDYEE